MIRAAELHDIGMVAIPDEILHKRGPLSDAEWALMRKHTMIGERVGAAPAMRQVAKVVRATHEHWNGSGYPDGLAGEEITPWARIILDLRRLQGDDRGAPLQRADQRQGGDRDSAGGSRHPV